MASIFSKDKKIRELLRRSRELKSISGASAILEWDQETFMPPEAATLRAGQLSVLAGIYHDHLISRDLRELLKSKGKNIYDTALLRLMKRSYEKEAKLPKELVEALSRQTSLATASWQEAKKKSDFSIFQSDLEKLLALSVKAAKYVQKKGQSVYDVMLDDFEEGLTEKETERIFEALKPKLVVLAQRLSLQTRGAGKVLKGKKFAIEKQKEIGEEIIRKMGFNFEAGRQDIAAHPFTQPIGTGDVRITSRYNESSLMESVLASIHEAGHALYYQGVDTRFDETSLYGSASLGMSESQSRFWENHVGRSLAFWNFFLPLIQRTFPEQLGKLKMREFVKAVNVVEPSLIRTEADEVTYGLHIILRFDIERQLVSGKIKVADLPAVWNQKMKEYLGIVPGNERVGVLQDIHWAHGTFGYFPTYLLGNLIAAQVWYTIKKQMPTVEADIQKGELKPLREWLRVNIYQYGKLYKTGELVKKVTGEDLNPDYFIRYLEEKFSSIYK